MGNISDTGGFRPYKDPSSAGPIGGCAPRSKPKMARGASATYFSGTESLMPYGLTDGGVPEEVLLFIIESMQDVDSVELISFCLTMDRPLTFSCDVSAASTDDSGMQKRWWPACMDMVFPAV